MHALFVYKRYRARFRRQTRVWASQSLAAGLNPTTKNAFGVI